MPSIVEAFFETPFGEPGNYIENYVAEPRLMVQMSTF